MYENNGFYNNDDEKKDYNMEDDLFKEEMYENYNIPEDIIINKTYDEKEVVKEKKKWKFRGSLISYIALALVASLIGGFASAYIAPSFYGNILPNPEKNYYEPASQININTSDDINTISAVVKKSISSVVGITTIEIRPYLFSEQEVEGVGSGVIVDSNGFILTNSHVVADGNAKSVNVLFENGDKLPATILWNDVALDLAVIKVDATNLPAATLGDSDELEVGEIAVAIGNPLGLEFQRSVTSGIISGLNRSIKITNNNVLYGTVQTNIIENLIQTDASINSGNSGGPLLNSKGEVIGINTAKIKSAEGLGFSIPINEAKMIIEEVIKNGAYRTVLMGISGRSVDEYQARLGVNLSVDKGVILVQVGENTPASKAGLLIGDIITKIDDVEIDNINQLKKVLYRYKLGDKATVTIIRNNSEMKIDIEFSILR